MSEAKKTLELDQYEYGIIFHSLNDKRNQMIQENEATDAVDDVQIGRASCRERVFQRV